MDSIKYSENIALEAAVKKSDIHEVHQLLEKGANPNFKPRTYESLMHLAVAKKNSEIIKLLVEYGAIVKSNLVKPIFYSQPFEYFIEVMVQMIEYNKNIKLIQMIFIELVSNPEYEGPIACRILMYLLHNGLPLHDYIEHDSDGYAPLNYAVYNRRIPFVLLLLQQGADVNRTTMEGNSCLILAVRSNHQIMVELLLKKGADINVRAFDWGDRTALHVACISNRPQIARMLLDNGADVNILDNFQKPPLLCALFDGTGKVLVKELAKLRFNNQFICPENLAYFNDEEFNRIVYHSEHALETFERCLEELQRMKDHLVFGNFSLYDILTAGKQCKKFDLLMKNNYFVEKFKSCWNLESFQQYGQDLNDVFEKALEKREFLLSEEKELYSIFKYFLPEIAIRKISYYVSYNSFFYTQYNYNHRIPQLESMIRNI